MGAPEMSRQSLFARLSSGLDRICIILAAALFVLNVGDIIMGVVMRYFFSSSPVWTEELARYSLIWMVMMAAAPALKRSEHMTIEMVVERFPAPARAASRWATHAVFLGITGFMAYIGYFYAMRMEKFTTMGLGISKSIPLMAIPAGMALLFIQYLLIQLASRDADPGSPKM